MMKSGVLLLICVLTLSSVNCLIVYDCGSRNLNVTTLSLINIGECDIPENNINVTRKYIQLLQINKFHETTVYQCKIEIRRTIYRCGMFSHISLVNNGETEYISDIDYRKCINVHRTGMLKLSDRHVIYDLKINKTIVHPITFVGNVNSEGECSGSGFSDPYGTWNSVVVQGTVKITLMQYNARISLEDNRIHLRSGTPCPLNEGMCIDTEGGYTFWNSIPSDNCKFNQYSILYEGDADKINSDRVTEQDVYSLATSDITFVLTAKSKQTLCGYTIIKTEHPKLVIFETSQGNSFAQVGRPSKNNLDLFAYVNSKFVYVERHIRTQIKQLYRDVTIQRCHLEKQTLKNSLSIATHSPDEFAYDLMRGPGYMALVAGEVVHIIKCIPVEVIVKTTDQCYQELQVSWKNSTYFITPRTHILTNKGTQIKCNPFLPSYYYLGESWYKMLPKPVESLPPTVIKPLTRSAWTYRNPSDLATSGIYTENDLKELRDIIMFPVDRPAYLNNLALGMDGHPVADRRSLIMGLIDEESMEKIVTSGWNKMWGKFLTFGTATAGLIGLITIIHIIKSLVDVFIRGYTLHTVFGWSYRLLGAVWSSISHLLIHLYNSNQQNNIRNNDIELGNKEEKLPREEEKLSREEEILSRREEILPRKEEKLSNKKEIIMPVATAPVYPELQVVEESKRHPFSLN